MRRNRNLTMVLAPAVMVGIIFWGAEGMINALAGESLSSPAGPDSRSGEVDRLFSGWNRPNTPGATVAVMHKGAIVFQKSYGRKHSGYDLSWNPQTRSRIYSMTKHFTGIAALILEDQGKLDLDDDVRKYLPEMPVYEKEITLRHLLSNTSGIRDDEQILTLSGLMDGSKVSLDYYFETVTRQKRLNFLPGAACLYSNSGFRMMARIIERVGGKSFPQWMSENIFEPLGMDRTLVVQNDDFVVRDLAEGYDRMQNGTFEPAIRIFGTSGDGAVVSTVPDMLKWVDNFKSNCLHIRDFPNRLVAKTPLTGGRLSRYGLGICVDSYGGLPRYHHGGGAPGYRSEIAYFPEQDFAVIILANRSDADSGTKAETIAEIYLGEEMAEAEKAAGGVFHPEERTLKRLEGMYVDTEMGLVAGIVVPGKKSAGDIHLGGTAGFISVLKAVSNTAFEPAVGYSSVRMRCEYRAQSEHPVLHIDVGREGYTEFVRVSDFELSSSKLTKYKGLYRSEEVAASLHVVFREGRLFLRLGFGIWPTQLRELEPVFPDIFSGPGVSVKFLQKADEITGMVVNTSQSRYLEFLKQ